MKKPVAPRIAVLLVLYFVVFTLVVTLQFRAQKGFVLHVGAMTISGHYDEAPPSAPGGGVPYEYFLDGAAQVFFGGMEFRIDPGDGFAFLRANGTRDVLYPYSLTSAENTASFSFTREAGLRPGGETPELKLVFTAVSGSNGPELRVTGVFGGDYGGAELPYRPMRSARIWDLGNDQFTIASGGVNYGFGRSALDTTRRLILLEKEGPAVSYQALQDEKVFAPADYVLAQAWEADKYGEQLASWQDQIFAVWNRTPTSSLNNEELIIAYVTDGIHRGNYREVISRTPRSFLESSQRTYVSSVFFGRLDASLRSLSAAERERAATIAGFLRNGSVDFLKEPHFFAECLLRSDAETVNQGLALISSWESAEMTLELSAPMLEAYTDLAQSGKNGPLELWVERALVLVSENIRRDNGAEGVLVFFGDDDADTEFNLRLGMALNEMGRLTGRDEWAAVGRSLIITVLGFTDAAGTAPVSVSRSEDGLFSGNTESRIPGARLYRGLGFHNYPRTVPIAGGINGWAWTASPAIEVTRNRDITDIAVTFPVGETHYMIIRGIRPFTKVQLYGIDYRTDPQFERYDSSGWAYSGSEQSLLLKIKHRETVEHIVIYTAAPPQPSPAPISAPETETAGSAAVTEPQ
ncbi:MAG: hypothetical protein LBT16_13515 [Treponema sp.]|nr:hypothetical protein [Treponema sp.]